MERTSVYSKVREILRELDATPLPTNDLIARLRENRESFIYLQKDNSGQVSARPCNDSTIRRIIQFAVELGLLAETEPRQLTQEGRTATEPGRYDDVLRTAVLQYLEDNGVSWPALEKAIEKADLPEPDTLHRSLGSPLSRSEFRTCLYILSLCGAETGDNILKPYIRKLYLT